jgi:hypothetical protein
MQGEYGAAYGVGFVEAEAKAISIPVQGVFSRRHSRNEILNIFTPFSIPYSLGQITPHMLFEVRAHHDAPRALRALPYAPIDGGRNVRGIHDRRARFAHLLDGAFKGAADCGGGERPVVPVLEVPVCQGVFRDLLSTMRTLRGIPMRSPLKLGLRVLSTYCERRHQKHLQCISFEG